MNNTITVINAGKDKKTLKYQEVNGTCYHLETSQEMINLLERLRNDQTRVRFHWGNPRSGKDWNDINDVAGRIGRSTGTYKIPLLIANNRSMGGGALLDHCIVKITYANKKQGGTIYQHPNYHK
jgi:hypothetical protein